MESAVVESPLGIVAASLTALLVPLLRVAFDLLALPFFFRFPRPVPAAPLTGAVDPFKVGLESLVVIAFASPLASIAPASDDCGSAVEVRAAR